MLLYLQPESRCCFYTIPIPTFSHSQSVHHESKHDDQREQSKGCTVDVPSLISEKYQGFQQQCEVMDYHDGETYF